MTCHQVADSKLIMDIELTLSDLSAKRKVFHSEADFQHALAWEIRSREPSAEVRLEKCFNEPEWGDYGPIYLDCWLSVRGRRIALELKYKTRQYEAEVSDESFSLKDQSAHDAGRFDFIRDIERLEKLVHSGKVDVGYAVFLTNDDLYWDAPKFRRATNDEEFRLHQGRQLKGEMNWGSKASKGTRAGRDQALGLNGSYDLNWVDYGVLGPGRGGVFRYLVIEVG